MRHIHVIQGGQVSFWRWRKIIVAPRRPGAPLLPCSLFFSFRALRETQIQPDTLRDSPPPRHCQVTTGSEAVLEAYSKVGLGWLMNVLRLPVIRFVIDRLYAIVSKHRYSISKWLPGGKALSEGISQLKDVQSASDGVGCEDEEECMLDYDDDEEEDEAK